MRPGRGITIALIGLTALASFALGAVFCGLLEGSASWAAPSALAMPLVMALAVTAGVVLRVWRNVLKKEEAPGETKGEFEKLKADFISLASHELRTPLTAVREAAAILVGEPDGNLTPVQQKMVSILNRNTARLCALVNDMIDVSLLKTGRLTLYPSKLDVRGLVRGAIGGVSVLAREKNVAISTKLEDAPPVFGDPDRLTQVLTNLLTNSILYTSANTRVEISAEREVHAVAGGWVRICVADNGPGIPESDIPHLFSHFNQMRRVTRGTPQGMGLGLALCRDIIERHGGRVWVETYSGVGTRVYFVLPEFSPSLWWEDSFGRLRRLEEDGGMVAIGAMIEPAEEEILAMCEESVRSSVKKQDRVLAIPENGTLWFLGSARKVHGDAIASRLGRVLKECLEERRPGGKARCRLLWLPIPPGEESPLRFVEWITKELEHSHEQDPSRR